MASVKKQSLGDPGGLNNSNNKRNSVRPVSPNSEEKPEADSGTSALRPLDHFKSVTVNRVSVPMVLYRRPLPQSCIAFASDEGKEIFKEALLSDHMACYFRLAAQFRTQDEPAYCGLATLVMVLNALEIDPGRVWKGPWKWYHEDMLDCCIPTQLVREQGITFDEFSCLADCNYLDTQPFRVDQSSNEDDFRNLVKEITLKEDTFLICSYSRRVLGQTGDGHFAPVSGYHPDKDLVLILDTARFKYPPHWIPLSLLFESMKALDQSTGLPRGYIQVWPAKQSKSLLLFKIAEQLSVNADPEVSEHCQRFLSTWTQLLSSPVEKMEAGDMSMVRQTLHGLVEMSRTLGMKTHVLSTQEHISCSSACSVKCVVEELLAELAETALFKSVSVEVLKLPPDDLNTLENIFARRGEAEEVKGGPGGTSVCCDMTPTLCLSHFVTIFLFTWPYSVSALSGTLGFVLQALSQKEQSRLSGTFLLDEIATLSRQLKKLTGFHSHVPPKSCGCKKKPLEEIGSKDSVESSSSAGKQGCSKKT
ncbi:hypothetical protein V1264_016367 [Littorina saxatilis]|uniref:glutathione gamma-glutamylcysteinyltransferase n=2 Tax=Littorina saxatilis TaxID=31220 RepID=A0AAN9GI28_9CAEN